MKKYSLILALALIFGATPTYAIEEFHVISAEELMDLDTVGDSYVAKPRDVAKAQHTMNLRLQKMYDTYSLPELAQQALQINQARIRSARRAGKTPPMPLTREILSDREKIIEYLKSEYKIEY